MKEFDDEQYRSYARLFKALADPTRLRILRQLQFGEDCANVIQKALGLTQSGLSYHMKILADARLVRCRTVGQRTYYSLEPDSTKRISDVLSLFVGL